MTQCTFSLLSQKRIMAPLFLGFLLLASTTTTAQVATENQIDRGEVLVQTVSKENKKSSDVYIAVEKRPEFPGGIQLFYDFIGKNFNVPKVKDLNGRIYVQFVIEKDGSLSDIKTVRDIGYGTKEEAIRVLKLSPKWIPGEQKGKKVRVQYSLPITISGN